MIEAEVCRQIFDFVAGRRGKTPSEDVFAELFYFEKKDVQSAMHALIKAGLLERTKTDFGFEYFVPKGVPRKDMETVFSTGTDFADIAALSPVPESKRAVSLKKVTKEDLREIAVARAKQKGDSVLESLERIADSSRKAADGYKGKDSFVKSVLQEAAKRSEDALSAYCDKLVR